jgi:hypothetical protein
LIPNWMLVAYRLLPVELGIGCNNDTT